MVNTHDENDVGIVKIKDSSKLQNYEVLRGKLQGSYFIAFRIDKVQEQKIQVQYRNSDRQYVDLKSFDMKVEAERVVNRLTVSKKTVGSSCRVGTDVDIVLVAYDRFGNVIQNVESEKMDLS